MDLKYAVLLMNDPLTFMERVELAIEAHGMSYTRETIECEELVVNNQSYLENNFVIGASPHEDQLILKQIPMRSGMSDSVYFICYSESGAVTAFYHVSTRRYGPHDVHTVIVAISINARHKSYGELNPKWLWEKQQK